MKMARSSLLKEWYIHAAKELLELEEEMVKIDFIFINMCQILR